jgi:hypothetical protein
VLQDGPDTWNSDDEAKTDVEADEEHDMYTAEMDPKLGPKVLSQSEAARQRATGKVLKSVKSSRSSTSTPRSTDEESTDSNEGNSIISSPVQTPSPPPVSLEAPPKALQASPPRVQSPEVVQKPRPAPGLKALLPPEEKGKAATRSRVAAEPSVQAPAVGAQLEIKKAAASSRAPADQPKGAKAPPPGKDRRVQ